MSVGKELAQLKKAKDPILRSQGDAYANMGSADMKGNDTSTAVRWYAKWCWFAGEEVISKLQAFSSWDEKRRVENKMIAFFIRDEVSRLSSSAHLPPHGLRSGYGL